jgi:hypothetical protein
VSEVMLCIKHISGWFKSTVKNKLLQFLPEIFQKTLYLKGQGVVRSRGLLSQFRHSALSCVPSLLRCNDLVEQKTSHKSQKAKHIFNYKLGKFTVCVLLPMNRTDTFRCELLLIFLEFSLKQVYDVHFKKVRLYLDSNQERDLPKARVQIRARRVSHKIL